MPIKKYRVEIEHFHDFLRREGLKKTYQKDLILETFLNTEGHLSVEDVYAQVKKRDKKVGVVTVFRTLRSLKECGIAREINLGDGLTRFEHCFQHPYHHHIICEKCHKAIEFVCPELESLQNHIISKYGFRTNHHWIQTYGICRDCVESRNVSAGQTYDTEMIFARDALKMALMMEERCLAFYRESARRNRVQGGKEVFERMIAEEEMHVMELQTRLDDLYRQEKTLEKAPVFLHFDAKELDDLIPALSDYEVEDGLSLDSQTAIDLTTELSKKSSDYFKQYADRFDDTLGKRIFMTFAVEEEKHSDIIRQGMAGGLQPGI